MALLCIPVPRLVSCTFPTIPICPFLIQRIFSFTCIILTTIVTFGVCIVAIYSSQEKNGNTHTQTSAYLYTEHVKFQLGRIGVLVHKLQLL